MRSLILDIAVIALGLLFLTSCAGESRSSSCAVDIEHMRRIAIDEDHARFAQVPDDQVPAFMDGLNRMEPPTDFAAAHVYSVSKPLAPVLVMMFDEHGCFTDLVGISPDDFAALLPR